jgi:hydrogenase maturation protein HypF
MGAELKNTVALAYDNKAAISPHIGDLETPEAVDGMKQVADCFPEFISRKPEAIAVDLHPDMHSTVYGKELAVKYNIPVIEVQHHYAHALSCMAENGIESALALVFDGTGLGTDGKIWGAELLLATPDGFERIASFEAVPLPGGDAATINPTRQLAARLYKAGVEFSSLENATEKEIEIWKLQCEKKLNAPESHAAGRVFDAFSAMLGLVPEKISYEGQAAIRLEAEAWKHKGKKVRKKYIAKFKTKKKNKFLTIDWSPAFAQFYGRDISSDKAEIAMGFHMAMAEAAKKMLEYGMSRTNEKNLAVSGGVFMNRILNELLFMKAEELGLKIHIQQKVPPNDGGISLGQAIAVGRADLKTQA